MPVRITCLALFLALAFAAAAPAPAVARPADPGAQAAIARDPFQKAGRELQRAAGALFAGLAGIIAIAYLAKRKMVEFAGFLAAAVVIGWVVASPGSVQDLGDALGRLFLGG